MAAGSAEFCRRPSEQVILASAGRIRSRGTGPWWRASPYEETREIVEDTRAVAPVNVQVKRLYSERREARWTNQRQQCGCPGRRPAGSATSVASSTIGRRSIACSSPWRRRVSNGEKRSSTSSIPSIVPSGCAAWRRSASARPRLGVPVRSRSGPGRMLDLRGGRFDQEAMIALLEETLRGAKTDGFGQTRLWANMEWALEEFPGVQDLVEFETRVNHILPKIRRSGRLCVRPHQVRRRRHDGCPPHPSAGHHRRVSPREPILRATRRIPARAPRPRRVDSAELTGDVRSPERPATEAIRCPI